VRIQQSKKKSLPISLNDIFDVPASPSKLQDETGTKSEFDIYVGVESGIQANLRLA